MSRIDTLVCTDARKTKYRFVVLTMIFLVYAINYADRTNIGAVLPFIIDEFHINNFEAGAIASMFFQHLLHNQKIFLTFLFYLVAQSY